MRANVVERTMTRFLRRPPSVRGAASVIGIGTTIVVIWVGMWWSLQTVTTVGYGDVTPAHRSGRIIAAFVMLEGIAFVTIVIAAITSTFVARAAKDRGFQQSEMSGAAPSEAQLDRIEERLARIERRLDQ